MPVDHLIERELSAASEHVYSLRRLSDPGVCWTKQMESAETESQLPLRRVIDTFFYSPCWIERRRSGGAVFYYLSKQGYWDLTKVCSIIKLEAIGQISHLRWGPITNDAIEGDGCWGFLPFYENWEAWKHRHSSPRERLGNVPKRLRKLVFLKDGHCCRKCGSGHKLTIDHIIPVTRGGTNRPTNLQTLCATCNTQKSNWLEGEPRTFEARGYKPVSVGPPSMNDLLKKLTKLERQVLELRLSWGGRAALDRRGVSQTLQIPLEQVAPVEHRAINRLLRLASKRCSAIQWFALHLKAQLWRSALSSK